LERWALPAILVLGALNFFWQLGSSSYFVDETLSIEASLPSLGQLLHVVRTTETNPWAYFAFLHEWLARTGSQSEWVTRLPSAVAGIALVGAVYWMAGAFLDRRHALLAAAFCALSPLVLEYAQQVRMYVFVMLAVTIAVGATVRAVSASADRARLLAVGAAAAALSLWLHYTAAFVILPLCVWLGTRTSIPWRSRVAFIGVCVIAALAVLPLLIAQYDANPGGGLIGFAGLTWTNVVRIAQTPFDPRSADTVNIVRLMGVAAVVGSILVLALRKRSTVRNDRLLVALGLLAPLALLAGGIAGKDVVITRYTAVAAPFLLTAIAAAVAVLPRAPAIVLLAATLVVAGLGLADSHSRTGFYAPAREAIQYIGASHEPTHPIVMPVQGGSDIALGYYGQQLLHPAPQLIASTSTAQVDAALAARRPLWIIGQIPNGSVPDTSLLATATAVLRPVRYRPVSVRAFTTTTTFTVVLAVPTGR
jgi:hypothetical protein